MGGIGAAAGLVSAAALSVRALAGMSNAKCGMRNAVTAVAVLVVLSGCADLREFANEYEREARFEYRTEQGSAAYVIRRKPVDFHSPNTLIPAGKTVISHSDRRAAK